MLHSGDGCTHFSSIIESRYSAKPQVLDIPCGADLTEIVRNAIRQQYCEITTEQARLIKESLVNNCEEYELPNGTKIEISRVKALVEHALFDEAKLHEKIHRYIELSNEFQRSTLYYNVILSGGNTLFDCFGKDALWKRMNKVETNSLLCDTRRGNIVTPLDRDLSIWIGGSILGSLSTIQYSGLNIRKEEYEEKGAERFYLNNTMLDEL
jgi:actin-related protein